MRLAARPAKNQEGSVDEQVPTTNRRGFVKAVGGAALGVSAASALPMVLSPAAEPPLPATGQAETLRMLADLQRALVKEPEDRRWTMVIDTRRCIGCSACTVACVAENNLPPGVTYRTVPEVEIGSYPDLQRVFMPRNCMQCDKAPCVGAANAVIPGAMKKRPDGIVEIDYAKMKGRRVFEAAKKACPYGAALYYDEGKNHTDGTPALQPYERRAAPEYGRAWTRRETAGTTRKCHFCAQRLDAGLLPACVSTCTGLAMRFGDGADPQSLVAEMVATGQGRRLDVDKGTEPRVFYVDDWEPEAPAAPAAVPANRPRVDCMACHSFGR
jgi:molybdopterin-containing oxidoreductase family iron-sulfur binding subunit